MLERKDRRQDTTTTTGTGTISLDGSADTGYLPFDFTDGATIRYLIQTDDKSEWEVGEGVFTSGTPDTLSRVTIYASSNAGSLVNFSAGTKKVYCVITADDILGGQNSIIANETPTGSINGSNTSFALANSPISDSLALYLNGQRLVYTTDYTLSGDTITMVTAPYTGDVLRADYLLAGAGSGNADTLDGASKDTDGTLAGDSDSSIPTEKAVKTYVDTFQNGWIPYSSVIPTRASADDPTYVLTFAGVDLTDTMSAGMKVKFTQNSATVYGIITAISFSTNTTLTLYCGTDYDVLDTATYAISAFNYSTQKAPVGFPLDPTKWTVEVSTSVNNAQTNPAANTWYNVSALTINVPIGIWLIGYQLPATIWRATNGIAMMNVTLSTTNNSETNHKMTTLSQTQAATDGSQVASSCDVNRQKVVSLTSKTPYYINMKTPSSGVVGIEVTGQRGAGVVRAVCAYL